MFSKERQLLEEELIDLKKLMDFYVGFRGRVLSINDDEIDEHIDDILERITEILNQLDNDR